MDRKTRNVSTLNEDCSTDYRNGATKGKRPINPHWRRVRTKIFVSCGIVALMKPLIIPANEGRGRFSENRAEVCAVSTVLRIGKPFPGGEIAISFRSRCSTC